MATLVTGGTGFVGAHIVKGLAQAGHRVVSFDLTEADQLMRDFVSGVSANVTFVQGDILDRSAVERLGADHAVDKIVHAAVYTVNRVELETNRSRAVIDINIEGTANLLELARALRVDRFIYVSSGAVYGQAAPGDQTLNENTPPAPSNLYGITKYASEMLTRRYGELHGISTATARLSTPYGPMERVTGHRAVMSVFYDWTGRALRGEAIPAADLDEGRDYTYAADIADGIRAVLDAPVLAHGLYNITAGGWTTFGQLLDCLKEIVPSVRISAVQGSPDAHSADAYSRGPLSGHRLLDDLKWSPKYGLKAGLTEYVQWRRDSNFLE